MGNVFELYLANEGQPESGAYAELSLPATPYQMQDALDKVRLAEGDLLYWEVTAYRQFEELSAVLCGECGLHELNALAQRLEQLDDQQRAAFAGLVKMEQKKETHVPVSRLIDLAYSTDRCHVVDEALNDAQLGRFCAENGLFPGAEELPDALFDLPDFARIGREHRQREGGVLVARTADHPGGYVERYGELTEGYKTLDLTPKPPDYTILAKTYFGNEVKFPFPADEPMGTEPVCCVDCIVTSLIGASGGMETVDLLACRLANMEPRALIAYKALLELTGCKDLLEAEQLMDSLDQYTLSRQYTSPIDVAKGELSALLGEADAAALAPHLNLYQYGQTLIEKRGGALTSYGLLQWPGAQPVNAMREGPSWGGMEMT